MNNNAFLFCYSQKNADSLKKSLLNRDFNVNVANGQDWMDVRNAGVVFLNISDEVSDERYQNLLKDLRILRIARENIPVFFTSAGNDIDRIVQTMRAGASDYVIWPCDFDGVPAKLLELAESIPISILQVQEQNENNEFCGIVGQSVEMKRVFSMITKVSATSSTTLITGESGTGKELVCRAIHKLSNRANGPLIPVNCGAIPEELLESELFGHEKGAFTGAATAREGRFQMANGGTIFLDEVSEMSPKLQVKFLRVLQESEFERVGGGKTIRVDVRVIAATNRDLEESVAQNQFREDLFYRLNVIPLELPPLRDRHGDLSILIQLFMDRFQERKLTTLESISPDAVTALQGYHWPGNVRELENLIERMAILAEGPILRVEDLPERFMKASAADSRSEGVPSLDIPDTGIDLKGVLENIENQLIEKALMKSGGVKNRAAQLLGLNRTTLVEKLKKKGLEEARADG